MSIRKKLEDEFNDEMNSLSETTLGSDEYKVTMEGAMKLADRLITISKHDDDYNIKMRECENERMRIEMEEKQSKSKNRSEWAKILIPTGAACIMGVVTMIWEKTDTLTSTAGKNSLRDILSFKIK